MSKEKTYIFTWEDGHTSYETFESQQELNNYLHQSKKEPVDLIMYEPEDGIGFM
jgi:hypothetical protein